MSVSEDLLCAFELLKPLDGAALKKEMQKKRRQRSAFSSPRSIFGREGGVRLFHELIFLLLSLFYI